MRNPLRSEAEAFRFLLLTIGYFALIVIGAIINKWVGIAVFVVLTLVVLYVDLRCRRENFDLAVDEGRLPPKFDARFIRLWRYYLMYCEGGFRSGGIDVAQVTLVKLPQAASTDSR